MTRKRELVPVKRRIRVDATHGEHAARALIHKAAEPYGELAGYEPTPDQPLWPAAVDVIATVLEPVAKAPVRWDQILWALVALGLTVIGVIAAAVDVRLFLVVVLLTAVLYVLNEADKREKRRER